MALRRVFTYLGAVFLMSHIIFSNNVSAVDTVLDLNGYEIINSAAAPRVNCTFNDTSLNKNNVVSCGGPNSSSVNTTILRTFYTVDEWNMQRGDVVEFDILIWSPTNLASLDGFTPGVISMPYPFRVMSVTQKATNVFTNDVQAITNGTGGTLYNGNAYFSIFHYSLSYVGGNNVSYSLGWSSANDQFAWYGESLNFRMFNVVQWRLSGNGSSDQQNEINATNESVQQSESEGASSQSDAQTGTASLISTIGSAVSAITSASPTNCLINGNMGNFDMGQIDLCSNPVPAFVQIISSLILILITVPLCIVMFNRFIGLFRSFQG